MSTGTTCRSCIYYGGKQKGKATAWYICNHPIQVSLAGNRIDYIRKSCVMHERKGKTTKEVGNG